MLSEPFSGLRNPPNINYFQRHIGQSQVKTRCRKSLIDIRHSCDGFCTAMIANTDNIYIFLARIGCVMEIGLFRSDLRNFRSFV